MNNLYDSVITAVTVYRGSALVTRRVELDAGRNVSLLLPAKTRNDSVYVSVAGRVLEQRLSLEVDGPLFDRLLAGKERYRLKKEALERVTSRIRMQRIRLLDADIDLSWEAVGGHSVPVAQFRAFADFKRSRLDKLSNSIERLKSEEASLQRELQQLTKEIAEVRSSEVVRKKLTLRLSEESSDGYLLVTHLVEDATWEPVYTVCPDRGSHGATLSMEAIVKQYTGEDWDNVELTLSNRPSMHVDSPSPGHELVVEWMDEFQPGEEDTRENLSARLRRLLFEDLTTVTHTIVDTISAKRNRRPQDISVQRPAPVVSPADYYGARYEAGCLVPMDDWDELANSWHSSNLSAESLLRALKPAGTHFDPLEIVPLGATAERVPERCGIANNAVPHTVGLRSLKVEAETSYHCVPKKDLQVHRKITCRLPSRLTGQIRVKTPSGRLVDNPVVDWATPGELEVWAGTEGRIRVRRETTYTESARGALPARRVCRHRVALHCGNGTNEQISLHILEQIPVTDSDKRGPLVRVVGDPPWDVSEEPDDGGLARWTEVLRPGETRTSEFSYEIDLDAHQDLVGGTRREPV